MQPNPHDALVKATFSQPEHAAGILRHVLPPALVARLALPTLALRPGSYVDEALRERHVPRFSFLLDDISHATDEALKARAMSALGRLALWCLRHGREPEALIDELGRWLDLVHEVRRARNGATAMRSIWQYMFLVSERGKKEETVQRLLLAVGADAGDQEDIVSIADQFIEEGRAEGLREGRREGLQHTLLKQLRVRFGPLSREVTERVEAAGLDALDAWTDSVLTAPTLDDVLRGM